MSGLFSSTIHFRCSFELRAHETHDAPWSSLVKSIRHWIEQSPQTARPTTNDAFFGAWLFLGGEWKPPGQRYHTVRSARFAGTGDDQSPQYWAVRYEHPGEDAARTWRADIGVARLDERSFHFTMTVSHYTREGYIGREPASPLPTAPRLVGWLLNSPDWAAFAGSQRLVNRSLVLNEGDGEEFRRILGDPTRRCPIVLVSREFASGDFLIDPTLVARKLAGSAAVFESATSQVDRELEWCLGRRFSCWNGMIRVYQTGMRFDVTGEAKRQRYFWGKEISAQGSDSVLEMLVRGIARRAEISQPTELTSIEGVAAAEREWRMRELRASLTDKDRKEWVELLEAENSRLTEEQGQKAGQIRHLQSENADLRDQLSRLEYDRASLRHRATEAERSAKRLYSGQGVAALLNRLPRTVREVVGAIAQVHADRIAFTQQAIRSASDCDASKIHEVWSCLWAMSTVLHDLFFQSDVIGNVEQKFLDATGFSLAMTEGEMTKNDGRLMRLRADAFDGQTIEITPHVKIDKGSLRAYFCPFSEEARQLIVVGYIGHLDTAGTRRRKDR